MNVTEWPDYQGAREHQLNMRNRGMRARIRPKGGKWQVIIRDDDDPSLRTRVSGTSGIGGRIGPPPGIPARMPSPAMPRDVVVPDDGVEPGWDRPEGTWTKPQSAGTGWGGLEPGFGGPLRGMDMTRLRRKSYIKDRQDEGY